MKNYLFILLSFCFTWLNCRKFGSYLRQNLGSQQNIILMCQVVGSGEKVVGLCENNRQPITVYHIRQFWKRVW